MTTKKDCYSWTSNLYTTFFGCSGGSSNSPEVTACKKKCVEAAWVIGGQFRWESHCRETSGKCPSNDESGGPYFGCVLVGTTDNHTYCAHWPEGIGKWECILRGLGFTGPPWYFYEVIVPIRMSRLFLIFGMVGLPYIWAIFWLKNILPKIDCMNTFEICQNRFWICYLSRCYYDFFMGWSNWVCKH